MPSVAFALQMCGYCKALNPTWDALAEVIANIPKALLDAVDYTAAGMRGGG